MRYRTYRTRHYLLNVIEPKLLSALLHKPQIMSINFTQSLNHSYAPRASFLDFPLHAGEWIPVAGLENCKLPRNFLIAFYRYLFYPPPFFSAWNETVDFDGQEKKRNELETGGSRLLVAASTKVAGRIFLTIKQIRRKQTHPMQRRKAASPAVSRNRERMMMMMVWWGAETVDEAKIRGGRRQESESCVFTRVASKPLEAAAFLTWSAQNSQNWIVYLVRFFFCDFVAFLQGCFRFFLNARLISNKLVGNAAGQR